MNVIEELKNNIVSLRKSGDIDACNRITHEFYNSGIKDKNHLILAAQLFNINSESNNYIQCLKKILRIDSSNIFALNSLGQFYQSRHEYGDALSKYSASLKCDNNQEVIHYNSGIINQELNKYTLAESNYLNAIRINNEYPYAHANLANLLTLQGKHAESIKYWHTAHKLLPNDHSIQYYLATAYRKTGNLLQAKEAYENILERDNKDYLTNLDYTSLLVRIGDYSNARLNSEKSLSLYPNSIKLIAQRASIDERLGNIDAGINRLSHHINTSDEIDIDVLIAYGRLATSASDNATKQKSINLIEQTLTSQREIDNDDRIRLCFCIAQSYEKLNNYKSAFKYYQIANDLNKTLYDSHTFDRFIESILKNYDDSIKECASSPIPDSVRPIFIVGMPRSGSTLLERILSSHPDITAGGELPEIHNITHSIQDKYNTKLAYPYYSKSLSTHQLTEIAENHLIFLQGISSSKKYITDKMPDNFLYIGLIKQLFPNAIIIDCVRDPRDCCLSCYTQHFASNAQPYSYNLYNLVSYYKNYRRLMSHWQKSLGIEIIRIQYEDLIEDIKKNIKPILAACNLQWNEQCLMYYKRPSNIATASYAQVTKPIYATSVGRWNNYMQYSSILTDTFGDDVKTLYVED